MPRRVDVTVFALLFICVGGAFLFLSAASVPWAFRTAWEYDCGVGFTAVFVLGVSGIFGATTGIGMLKLRRWAYWMGLIAGAVFVFAGVRILTLRGAELSPADRALTLTFAGVCLPIGFAILWFLLRRPVRHQFVTSETSAKKP